MANENYVEDHVIEDVDGVVIAVITYRTRANGSKTWSYSFMRSFDDGGRSKRTCWLNERHLDAVARLVPKINAYLIDKENENH
jgi:hypothetical protein